MGRKFGKRNVVSSDLLSHGLGIIGPNGVGKTTLMRDFLEKVGGPDCYLFCEFGREAGADEIDGIVYENVPDWDTWAEICDDIIENRETDYKDLRMIVVDSFDEYMSITEQQAIKLWNRENPNKKATSLRQTWGGFSGPTDKVIEIAFDKLWQLRECGIYFSFIGHTKRKEVIDPVTEEAYSIITTNMDNRYFTAMTSKIAVLGVAYIDRDIVKQKTGRKNVVTGQEEVRKTVTNEARVLCFRDDNFSVDSKSRFKYITDKIPLDADALIKALEDAIKAEHEHSGKTAEQVRSEQTKIDADNQKRFSEKLESARATKQQESLESHRAEWVDMIRASQPNWSSELKNEIKSMMNGTKLSDPSFDINTLSKIVGMIPKQ